MMAGNAGLLGAVEPTALAISLCMTANSSRLRRVVSESSSRASSVRVFASC